MPVPSTAFSVELLLKFYIITELASNLHGLFQPDFQLFKTVAISYMSFGSSVASREGKPTFKCLLYASTVINAFFCITSHLLVTANRKIDIGVPTLQMGTLHLRKFK